MERVLNCEISFQDLENSIGLCQSIHKVLKKYGNSKFSHLFIQILFFTADDSFADIFCFVLHEYNFGKMEISDGIKQHFRLVLEKYGKWILKMCGNPEIVEFQIFLQNFGETRIESSSPRKQSSVPPAFVRSHYFSLSVSLGQREKATVLAEKYRDFATLMRVCDQASDKGRMQEYMNRFSEEVGKYFFVAFFFHLRKRYLTYRVVA